MMNRNSLIIIIAFLSFGLACSNHRDGKPEPTDTPTSGEVKVVIDEGYYNLFQTQIYTFESIYSNADVQAKYLPESDALHYLINDSCKVVVISRDLSADERKAFESNNLFPVSTKIAEDAIALIINPANSDSVIAEDAVRNVLSGKDSSRNAVFDSKGSANARYMRDSLMEGKDFAKNVFALNSNPEVIDYVSKNKGAIGFISVNWISDSDDPRVQEIMKKVKVLAVSKGTGRAVKPEQAHIKARAYPFTRNVYMINRQTRAGLGMGFVSFVAGEKGQLMILKAGLIPGFPPERTVKIKY